MPDSEKVLGWIRSTIAYAIWTVVVVVGWKIVLSLESVQWSGFALEPFQSDIYPYGLPWILLIDVAFYAILMITIVSFTGRLRRDISKSSSRFRRLANVVRLAGILASVIIGYYAFDELVLPPLAYQNVEWAYNTILWVLVIGTSAVILFELVSSVILAKRKPKSVLNLPARNEFEETNRGEDQLDRQPEEQSEKQPEEQSERQPEKPHKEEGKCVSCGKKLPATALFCGDCGTRVD
jgi:hypothetical protein